MIGTTVGKYSIQDRIGRGGMGTVYLAVDATLRREVAIKVLNSELNDPEVARRFRSEAITVARLSHPGIATVYELFEHDGQWLMVMEFVRGETMEHLVERGGSLSVERAADLCVQALTALAHAHSMGVVHRDLKPANLMVTESGLVKVMDFGIARVAGSEHLTTAGFMMGTPAYMAPEQVLGHEIDARADLYAMGVVLYRLATSKLPFKGETPFAMAQSQVNDPPTPIRLMRDGLPVWIEQVIGRALSKSPADRFQTADEFRETLKRGLAGLPIESAPNAFMPPELSMTVALAVPSGDTGATPVGTSGQVPVAPAHTGPTAMPSGATPMASGGTPMPSGATAMPSGATPMASGATPMSTGAIAASSTSETRMMSGAIPMGTGATPMSTGATPSAGGTGATARPDLDASSAPTVMMGTGQGAYGAAGAGGTASVEAQTVRAAIPGASGLQEKKSSSGTMIALGAVVIAVIGLAAWWFSRGTSAPPTETPTPTATVAAIDATPTPTTATPDPSLTATPTPSVTATPSSSASPTPTGTLKPTPSVSATTTPTPTVADSHVVYSNVKMIEVTGKKGTERDINLSFVAGQISIVPRKGGEAVLTMPYRQIVKGTYVRAKDPKWDISLPYPMDGLDLPGLFRGAGEWLVLQWNTGYLILKLDGSNVREVLGTVEARTGAKIDRPAPGGK